MAHVPLNGMAGVTHEGSEMSKRASAPEEELDHMLRKISFAVVTAVALGTAALAPAPASAHGFGGGGFGGGWHGGGWGHRGYGYGFGYGYGRGWCYWHPYSCY